MDESHTCVHCAVLRFFLFFLGVQSGAKRARVFFRTGGYIVCEEHEEVLRAAWVEEQELQKQKEREVSVCVF